MIYSSQKHYAIFLVSVLSRISTVSRAHPGHAKFLDTFWSAVAQFVLLPPLKWQATSLFMSACSLGCHQKCYSHQGIYQLQNLSQLTCSTKKTYVTKKGANSIWCHDASKNSNCHFLFYWFGILLNYPDGFSFAFQRLTFFSLHLDQSASFPWLSREFHQSAPCSEMSFLWE